MSNNINIINLLYQFYNRIKGLKKILIIVNIVVLLLVYLYPKKYLSDVIVLPQTSNQQTGIDLAGFGSLANAAGLNLGAASNSLGISSTLYPDLLENHEVQLRLINTKLLLTDIASDSLTYKQYILEYYKPNYIEVARDYSIGLPSKIIKVFSSSDNSEVSSMDERAIHLQDDRVNSISRVDEEVIKRMRSGAFISIDSRNRLMTAGFESESPELSSQMTLAILDILKDKLTEFESAKAGRDYGYIKGLYEKTRQEYLSAQFKLAEYEDKNANLNTSRSKSELRNLQSEFSIVSSVYQKLATDLEQAKIKMEQDKPFFYVIKEITIPNKATQSLTKRFFLAEIVFLLFVSVLIALSVFSEPLFAELKQIQSKK